MSSIRVLATFAAALALAGAAPAAAQSPADPLATGLARATVVGAAGGWTAWSVYEGGEYRLVTRSPASVQGTAAVRGRKVPFDLDLGTDAKGRVVAAYSRCTTEPTLVGGANATAPNYATGKGCRIALLDLASGKERLLARSSGSSSDVLPSVGGSRIAFVAVPTSRRLRGKAQLRWRSGTSTTAKVLYTDVVRRGTPNVSAGPANVDTDGRRVAAVWRSEDPEFHSFDSVLRVQTFTTRARQVAYGTNNDVCNYDQVLAPTLTGTSVVFLETDGAQWMLARTPASRQAPRYGMTRTGDPGVVVTSAAVDGDRLVTAETTGGLGRAAGPTQVRQSALGAFSAAKPPLEFCSG